MTLRTACCTCGQLSARVSGEPVRISVCHCHACQRRSGSVFATQARFKREEVEITGSGTEYVRVGDAGGRARFTFCSTCGDTVYYVTLGAEETLVIPVGAFADSSFPAPKVSVYEDRKHPWVTMPQDMEHWA
jgi:hypothetical protein